MYSLFIQNTIDYTPPNTFNVRALHASPNMPAIDLRVNNSINFHLISNVAFETASTYQPFLAGEVSFDVLPTGALSPVWLHTDEVLNNDTTYSFFFIGLNATGNETSTLERWILQDDNTLPANAGDVSIRFVHASPNSPSLDLRINGVERFSNVTYKRASNYVTLNAAVYTFDLYPHGAAQSLLSSSLDLRTSTGPAVYTIVAEGLSGKEPALKLIAFRDAGSPPPHDNGSSSATKPGLTPVTIGLIIAGVALFVIIVAAGGFVFWKKRHARAGYSEIGAKE